MDKYKTTDIGLLIADNVKYLVEKGVLIADDKTQTYGIRDDIINRTELEKPVQLYSLFSWVVEDIRTRLQINDIDEVVSVMRCGTVMGDVNYPIVESIEMKGTYLIINRGNAKETYKTNRVAEKLFD